MNETIVRPANEHDLDSLCHLYYQFHQFHVEGVPDRLLSLGAWADFDCGHLRQQLQQIIGDQQALLLVAEAAGVVVGLAEAYLRTDTANPVRVARRYCLLQSLMVDPEQRRSGFGGRLVAAVEDWARRSGAEELRTDTWEFPAGPWPFYRAQGYRTYRRELVKTL